VTVGAELAFVAKYLDIERLRFGDRLRVTTNAGDGTNDAQLPAFAIQTLVENAVRHAVTPRVEATDVAIETSIVRSGLQVVVRDSGGGAVSVDTNGTGLKRLRERIQVLYQGQASLEVQSDGRGVVATMTIPQSPD
jgi:two-component system LytT family sensor kinase